MAAAIIAAYADTQSDKHAHWLYDCFSELDTDSNGTISEADFVQALCKTLNISHKEGQSIFQRLDTNGDQKLHHTEFVAAATSEAILSQNQNVCDTFNCFDADGDGRINIQEFVGVLGKTFCGENTVDIFRELDKNGDKGIDQTEFSEAVASLHLSEFCSDDETSKPDALDDAIAVDVASPDFVSFVSACSVDSLTPVFRMRFPGLADEERYCTANSNG